MAAGCGCVDGRPMATDARMARVTGDRMGLHGAGGPSIPIEGCCSAHMAVYLW